MSARGWAVVTGASSGIGEAFARALDGRGYSLLLVARRKERLAALASSLRRAEVLAADLGDLAEVERVAAHVQTLGDVELLVNNAGFASNGCFAELPGARELEMVRVNVEAPMMLAQRLLPSMIARRAGGIINISSIGAFQPVPYMATYGATKAFVLAWSEAIAEELHDSGVTITCVCPGPVATEFFVAGDVNPRMGRAPHVMKPEELVTRALDGFDDGRAVVVPGVINWLTAFVTRLAPRIVVRKVTARISAPAPHKLLRS